MKYALLILLLTVYSTYGSALPKNIYSFKGISNDGYVCHYNILDLNDGSGRIGVFLSDGIDRNFSFYIDRKSLPLKNNKKIILPRDKGRVSNVEFNENRVVYNRKEFFGVLSFHKIEMLIDAESDFSMPTYYEVSSKNTHLLSSNIIEKFECFIDSSKGLL